MASVINLCLYYTTGHYRLLTLGYHSKSPHYCFLDLLHQLKITHKLQLHKQCNTFISCLRQRLHKTITRTYISLGLLYQGQLLSPPCQEQLVPIKSLLLTCRDEAQLLLPWAGEPTITCKSAASDSSVTSLKICYLLNQWNGRHVQMDCHPRRELMSSA